MSEHEEKKLDRREFLQRAGLAGVFAVGAGRFAAGCKKGGSGGGGKSGDGEKSAGTEKSAGSAGEKLDCTDTSGLSDSEKKRRTNFKYTEHSEKEDKHCSNCNLYEPPDKEGACGSCTLVPGPIHPDGWCNQWVKKS